MIRRNVLKGLMALAATPAISNTVASDEPGLQFGAKQPFSADDVIAQARRLAATDFVEPQRIPAQWSEITYEDYVSIWFDSRNGLFEGTDAPGRILSGHGSYGI